MSFFEDASLVLIPSAQKLSKIYSVKPSDGSGDLVFTRSNDTATRVGPDGLIEKVRTNRALYSEDQTAWTDQNQTSVTANAAANPLNGAVTADKVIPSATTDDHYRGLSMGSMVGEISSSIYVKADGYSIIDYGIWNATATTYPVRAVFDLSTQTITQISGSISSITSVGSGWYRISVTGSVASTSTIGIFHRVRPSGTGGTYAGDGTSGMLLWGCQLESGVTTSYIGPTTSAAVSVGPVANVPRLDYSGGSSCPRLLLEPQRVNLALFSESFDNAGWTKTRTTVSANAATSPDGYTNADKIIATVDSGSHFLTQNSIVTASANYNFSIFAKKGEEDILQITFGTSQVSGNPFANVDLSSGLIYNFGFDSIAIESLINGWYRINVQVTSVGVLLGPIFGVVPSTSSVRVESFTGDGISGVYIWGAQLEAGTYATSYIPTLGAAVTRGADDASKTGISSIIGQTEGTLFFEIKDTEHFTAYFGVDNVSTGTRILVYGVDDKQVRAQVRNGGTVIFSASSGVINGGAKAAVAFNASESVFYVNGVQIGSGSGTTYTNLSQFTLNHSSQVGASLSQALLFKTRLTNAQLAELTTI